MKILQLNNLSYFFFESYAPHCFLFVYMYRTPWLANRMYMLSFIDMLDMPG